MESMYPSYSPEKFHLGEGTTVFLLAQTRPHGDPLESSLPSFPVSLCHTVRGPLPPSKPTRGTLFQSLPQLCLSP